MLDYIEMWLESKVVCCLFEIIGTSHMLQLPSQYLAQTFKMNVEWNYWLTTRALKTAHIINLKGWKSTPFNMVSLLQHKRFTRAQFWWQNSHCLTIYLFWTTPFLTWISQSDSNWQQPGQRSANLGSETRLHAYIMAEVIDSQRLFFSTTPFHPVITVHLCYSWENKV